MARISPLWQAFLLLPWLALAADEAAVTVRSYALPGHGRLELKVPSSWKESVRRPPADLPPTIEFSPAEGDDVNLQITPLWSPEAQPGFNSLDGIRSLVETIGRRHLAESVETAVTLKEIKGPEAAGYAFTLTDRAPKVGEWKYVTSGAVGLSDLLITFTILTNRLDGDESRQALRIIEESRRTGVPEEAPPAAAATSTLRKITYPGKKWSLVLDLPGFEFEERATRQDMTGVRVLGNNPGTGVIASIFLEKADHPGDAKAFRELYWSKTKRARPASKDIRFSERGDMALLERMIPRVEDIELNHEHLNAFMSYDGVWIDIHLSKVKFRPEDQRLFEDILDTVLIVDPSAASRVAAPGAAGLGRASSPISFPVPGRDWTLVLDTLDATLTNSPVYEFDQKGVQVIKQRVVGSRHEGGSEKSGLVFLVNIGEDTGRGDSKALRDDTWKKVRLNLGGRPRDVRFYERGELALVDYMLPKFVGKKADVRNVIAYLSRDGIAIAVSVAKVDYRPEDAPAFEAVLGSLRVAESAPTPP